MIAQPTTPDAAARERLEALVTAKAPAPDELAPEPVAGILERIAALPRATEDEGRKWTWENETLPRVKACGFESRFWRDRRAEMTAQQRSTYECVGRKCQGRGAIIVLAGGRGTGKTTICAALAMDRAEDATRPPWERQPTYRKMMDLVAFYKSLYADFGSTTTDVLMSARDAFCRGKLAFIDEVHECDDQKLKDRVLTDLLDRRYAARNDTVLLSNQTAADFQRTTNDSIRSRISEHGMVIECCWPSFRTPKL